MSSRTRQWKPEPCASAAGQGAQLLARRRRLWLHGVGTAAEGGSLSANSNAAAAGESVQAHELISAFADLLWPVILLIVILALLPAIRTIVQSRSFTVKVGDVEVSVQDAANELRTQVDDLQRKVIELRSSLPAGAQRAEEASAPPKAAPPKAAPASRGVLWVDDKPSNNAIEVANLRQRQIPVKQVTSTADAMAALAAADQYAAVISDMGRFEHGRFRGRAGLDLLEEMRRAEIAVPFMVYTSRGSAARQDAQVREAGGHGATASPVELLEWLRDVLGGLEAAVPPQP